MGFLDGLRKLLGSGSWSGDVTAYGVVGEREMRQREVKGLAFSPDGAELTSLSYDGVLQVGQFNPAGQFVWAAPKRDPSSLSNALVRWSVAERAPTHALQQRFKALTSSADGRVHGLVAPETPECKAQGAQVVDAQSGELLLSLPEADALALSGDGQLVLSAAGTLLRCRARSGELRWETDLEGTHHQISLDPQGRFAAAGGADGLVILDAAGTRLHSCGSGRIFAVVFTGAGQLLSASKQGVQLWDAASGELRWTKPCTGSDYPISLASSPNGRTLASGYRNGNVRVWSAIGSEGPEFETAEAVGALAFSHDGTVLASGCCFHTSEGAGGAIQLWDPTGKSNGPVKHTSDVKGLRVSSDGRRLLSIGDDRRAIAWTVGAAASGRLVNEQQYVHRSYGIAPDLSHYLHEPGSGKGLERVALDGGERSRVGAAQTEGKIGAGFELAPDGKRVALLMEGALSVVDVASGDELLRRDTIERPTPKVAFVAAGSALAISETASEGGKAQSTLRLLKLDSGQPLIPDVQFPPQAGNWINELHSHEAGTTLLICWQPGNRPTHVDVASGTRTRWSVDPGGPCWAVSPDGSQVATVANWNQITLRDAKTGKPLTQLPPSGGDKVTALCFAPDGSVFAGYADGRVASWIAKTD